MKLLLLTSEFPPFNGGVGTYSVELAAIAAAAGHQVTVLAPDYGADQAALDASLPVRVVRFAGGAADAKGLPARIKAARTLLARERFDVIHAADWPFFIPVLLARRAGARVIFTVHGTEILYMKAAKRQLVLRLLGVRGSRAIAWIGNSRYTTELLLETFPWIGRAQTRAVPLGVGERWRAARTPRPAARDRWGVAPEDLVIVSLGRVVPRKGHLDLADALSRLPQELAGRVRWWIIGPLLQAEHEARLRARIAQLPVQAKVFGKLPEEEVASRLSGADLFCLPGYQDEAGRVEGFGLVFLEAAAFGVPAIATRSGGIAEAVIDGETGLLVAERDPTALVGALVRVLGDDELRARLSTGAEAHAATATWDRVMRDTYEPA